MNVDCPDPIVYMSLTVHTSGHLYLDFRVIRLFFLQAYRETSTRGRDLETPESEQIRFLHTVCLTNLKGCVGLNLGNLPGFGNEGLGGKILEHSMYLCNPSSPVWARDTSFPKKSVSGTTYYYQGYFKIFFGCD